MGEEEMNGYQYLIYSSIDEIKLFYNKELMNRNWKLLSTSENDNRGIALRYKRCTDELKIEIVSYKNRIVMVIIQAVFRSCY